MSLPKLELHCVTYTVKPEPSHPLFWEMQFGLLHIYIHAADLDDAVERSREILELLPFEQIGTTASVLAPNAINRAAPSFEDIEKRAKIGFTMDLVYCEPGAVEPQEPGSA